jgi:hypothetical protein
MSVKTARTTEADSKAAASEIAKELSGASPKFVLFFVSSSHDPSAFADALQKGLGDVTAVGCTTAGELVDDLMLEKSAVGMGLGDDVVASSSIAVVRDLSDPESIKTALGELAQSHGTSPNALDASKLVGLVLHDGLSVSEERVMDVLGTLTNVPFIGGSAGDELAFEKTYVFANGEPMSGRCVLALLELKKPYQILKTQSFDVLDKTLEVTDADEATRTVHAFNGKPAAQAYAETVGCSVEDLPSKFQSNPVGLVTADGEPFVRSPQQIQGDDVVFYCQIKKGMKLNLLQARDIVDDTRRDLSAKIDEMGGTSGIINFHCILRTIELQQKDQTESYGKVFAGTPTVGFSTYGESYIGHVNQTSTMLLFGK